MKLQFVANFIQAYFFYQKCRIYDKLYGILYKYVKFYLDY